MPITGLRWGAPDLGYLPRGNPGVDLVSTQPRFSQTSGGSQNRLKDLALGIVPRGGGDGMDIDWVLALLPAA
jgi:hypothetical protein